MKNKTILVCFLLFVFGMVTFFVGDITINAEDEQLCNNANTENQYDISDNFSDDKVIVVLNKDESFLFKNYKPDDFSEVGCVSVKDLTGFTVNYVKEKMLYPDNTNKMLVDSDNFRRILSLELKEKSKENVLSAIKVLSNRKEISSAEPNIIFSTCSTSMVNDPQFIAGNQWGLSQINIDSAWEISPVESVVVGILDSGIDATHPDLINNIHRSVPHNYSTTLHRDFTTGNVNGIPIVDPVDEFGHGTHVAGIIGAQCDNKIGIAGLSRAVKLVSLRILDSSNGAKLEWLASAINYAQKVNIPIINLSLGGNERSDALDEAIKQYKGLMIASAGNDDKDIDYDYQYPACYSADNIITVGASDGNNNKSKWNGAFNLWGFLGSKGSNYGKNNVDIFAPGDEILSTYPLSLCSKTGGGGCSGGCRGDGHKEYGYHYMTGTSMATPFVTGVAAMLLAQNPNLSVQEIKSVILDNVQHVDSLKDKCVSGGILDANAAVRSVFGYQISEVDSGVEIVGVVGEIRRPIALEIPEKFFDKNVVSIGSGCFANQSQMLVAVLPETITILGDGAFLNCSKLSNINIPSSLTDIGSRSFENCSNLQDVVLNRNVSRIGYAAFRNCIVCEA